MASLAITVVEGAALALMRALGFTAATAVGAAAINEAAKKKTETADKAATVPIAQAGTQTKVETCSKCPPDCGALVGRNWSMSEVSSAYQARITGFAPGTEWNFKGADFDGFRSASCLLLEAKAMYDQFFTAEALPKTFFKITGVPKMMTQAERQGAIIWSSAPSQLQWHFMQPLSYQYFSGRFAKGFLPIQCFLTP